MIFAASMILILLLIFIGVAIPLAFLSGSFFLALFAGARAGSFATNAYYMLDSISMLAIPLFVVGGQLVERSGIANVLIELGDRLLHKVKGGMAATIPVVSCFSAPCAARPWQPQTPWPAPWPLIWFGKAGISGISPL